MARFQVYGRKMTVRGVWPEDFSLSVFEFDPIPDDDAGSVHPLGGKGTVERGRSFSLDVEAPGEAGVIELAPGYKVFEHPSGRYASADDVIARAFRGEEGYRVISWEKMPGAD